MDNSPAEREGTREGWKECEGQRTCIHPHSTSPSVSLLLLVEKKSAEPPSSLYHCCGLSERLNLHFFFLFSQFIEQEKGMAVNSSANELAK